MDKPGIDSIITYAAGLYEDSPMAVAAVDKNLRVIWANRASQELFPSLRLPDGVRFMLPNHNAGAIIQCLARGSIFSAHSNFSPLASTAVTITPLLGGSGLCGAIVIFDLPGGSRGSMLHPEGADRTVMTFNNQFRTPISEIFSSLSVAARALENGDTTELSEYMSNINHNCYKMLRNIENISNYTKYNSAINEMRYERSDMAQFMRSLCEALSVMIKSQGIGFSFELPQEPVNMVFDADKISSAFLNIVSNSCRFTREGNAISVTMEVLPDMVIITVADKGAGIHEDIIYRVFDAYFSYDPEGMPFAGAGLGLTNAKFAVTAHGGTIAIRSVQGQGTSIAFTVPRRDDESVPLVVHSTTSDYLVRKFSPVHKMMCDTCPSPTP